MKQNTKGIDALDKTPFLFDGTVVLQSRWGIVFVAEKSVYDMCLGQAGVLCGE